MAWASFLNAVKVFLAGMVVLYAVVVFTTLRSKGARYELKTDPHDAARSAEQFLVWLGVRTVAAAMSALKAGLNVLEDTSADVGEWVLHRRNS